MKFIGMDAHSKTCFFVVLNKQGKTVHKQRINTGEKNILEFVRSVKGPKSLVFEEGVMSQWLYLLFHADNEFMNLRTLVSGYYDLTGVITREKNRYKALFRHVAIPTDSAKSFTITQSC